MLEHNGLTQLTFLKICLRSLALTVIRTQRHCVGEVI